MTLELCSNLIQAMVAFGAAVTATVLAVRKKTLPYTLVAGALVTFALGILYWLTYQFVTDVTPQIFYVADVSWFVAYLFLLCIQLYFIEPQTKGRHHILMYVPIPIGLALTIYFCQWGDILLNVSYMTILTICGYFAIRSLLFGSVQKRRMHLFYIVFILTEYALWVASCFWISDTWTNPYFWFDFALTIEFGLFLPLMKKVIDV